jgi:UDP-N-acetylmuramyl pentapeptide phosphotransferase/UDP-N-acetylglucosamine-1-phosphate transferase
MTALLIVFVFGPAIMNLRHGQEWSLPMAKHLMPRGLMLARVAVAALVWSNWSSIFLWITLAAFLLVASSSAFNVIDSRDARVLLSAGREANLA